MVTTLRPGERGGASEPQSDPTASGQMHHLGLEPDPARIQDGWQHRFVAEGQRAEEMITLYRELGFDVVADVVRTKHEADECSVCFATTGERYRAIYTRRSTLDSDPSQE